jgi:hypothetical protein
MLRQILAFATLAFAAQFGFAAEAGKVIFVTGKVQAGERALALNAAINEGELLSTGADGYLYIKTLDDGLFILRPNTRARIAAYHVDKVNPANTRVKLELLSGVARSQSGTAVKLARQNFRFNTPVAAIGVRGTDFTVFTDDQTSRVAVLSGGITISGFGAACRPEGTGPCEGNAARDLSASQKGLLLQIQRGQAAAQQVQGGAVSPDTIAPPRPDEPVAVAPAAPANNAAPAAPALDPLKAVAIKQQAENGANPAPGDGKNPPVVQPPPVVVVGPNPDVPVTPTPVNPAPTNPTVPVTPDQKIEWGRFAAVADQPANLDLAAKTASGSQLIALKGGYALLRSSVKDYVTPERGSIGFTLQGGEAYIYSDNVTVKPVQAQLENGALNFNFDTKKFATNFDLVNGTERITMSATGSVASDGRFSVDNRYAPGNNMDLDGVLSNENGNKAAYLFQGRIENNRSVNGVTVWTGK